MRITKKLNDWLQTQSKEFAEELKGKDMLGNGVFTLAELCELDKKFNPVGDSNE